MKPILPTQRHFWRHSYWLALCLCLNLSALAQTASIRGKIVDGATNGPLPGASVMLVGSTNGAATNLQGEFVIQNLREGQQTLRFSYLGYEEITQEITVQAGKTANFGIVKLTPSARSLDGVTVRGSLEGQQKALNQQRTSDNIKNIVSADLIGRFPDLNVAESLQRIPGINIERDRGEGGEVQMRGAPPAFTTININGEQIPGTQTGGQRNEELSLIPVDQLSSIEVTKAITSDQDGDNIGGTVDFKTPTGKDLKWRGKAELGGGYNNIVQRASFIGKFGVNRRFFASDALPDGRLGINVGGSYFGTNLGRDRTSYVYPSNYTVINGRNYVTPTYYRLRDLVNFRSRTGIATALDYKFSPRSEVSFNYIYSRRFDEDEEARTQFDFNRTRFSVSPDGETLTGNAATTVRRFINPRYNDVRNHSFSLSGNHPIGKATIDYLGFLSRSHNQAFIGRTYDLRTPSVATVFDNYGADFTNVRIADGDIHDPFLVRSVRNYNDNYQTITGRNMAAKVNVSIPYLLGGKTAQFKFGGKFRTINNQRFTDNRRFNFVNDGTVNANALFTQHVSSREDNTFLRSRVRFGPTLDVKRFDQFIAANPNVWKFDPSVSANESIPTIYNADEDVTAAYVMNKVQLNKLMILTGLRYENTVVNYTSKVFEFDANGNVNLNSIRDVAGSTQFNFLLPNVHLKYSVDDLTNLRFAFTTSYARSNFADLAPTQSINILNQSIDIGNPNLRPARSTNFDLLFERYFRNVGILSGGAFYKRITDFNFSRTFTEEREVFVRDETTGSFRPVRDLFNIEQTQNGDLATIYGFELNAQVNLDFLPGLLKGIGLYANYTHTQSKASTFDRKNVRLPGQAKHTGNLAVSYDYKKFTTRASFNFNGGVIRGLGPAGTEGSGDFDTYRADRYQLDLSASYAITKKLRAYAEFINLTNRPDVEYLGVRSRLINLEYYDWSNRFGVSYSF